MVTGPGNLIAFKPSGSALPKAITGVQFAGGPNPATSSPANSKTSHTPPKPAGKPLSWWGTIKALSTGLKDKDTQQVAKGFALKYIPDLVMSSLFAVPVFGWAAGVIASPITMFLSSKGEKLIAQSEKKLDKAKPLNKVIRHYRSLEGSWSKDPKVEHFPDHKGEKATRKMPEFVATKYNKIIKGLFHGQEGVFEKLRINHKQRSFIFKVLERMVHARQAVRQTWLIGKIFNWMSGIGNGVVAKFKPLQFLFLLPRMGLMSIYFILGRKPKFK